jgi:hypothetical protein
MSMKRLRPDQASGLMAEAKCQRRCGCLELEFGTNDPPADPMGMPGYKQQLEDSNYAQTA